jgi:hypothetical protein
LDPPGDLAFHPDEKQGTDRHHVEVQDAMDERSHRVPYPVGPSEQQLIEEFRHGAPAGREKTASLGSPETS